MQKLIKVEPNDNYFLTCEFEDGTVKQVDLSPLLTYPVFAPLKDKAVFKKIKNNSYFIEWEGYEIDISADTLFHFST